MKPADALAILDALVEGAHPFTGVALDGPAWLLDPRCREALSQAHAALEASARPPRKGQPWSHHEDQELLDAHQHGHPIAHIARHHGRTTGAIRSRLVRMGVVEKAGARADSDFLRAFDQCAIIQSAWSHRAHLRVAYCLLHDLPPMAAVDHLRAGIKALNAQHGLVETDTRGYHETLTVAWVRVVAGRVHTRGRGAHFADFIDQHPDLLDPKYLRRHYSYDRAMSLDARRAFLPADRDPLPPLSAPT